MGRKSSKNANYHSLALGVGRDLREELLSSGVKGVRPGHPSTRQGSESRGSCSRSTKKEEEAGSRKVDAISQLSQEEVPECVFK